MIPANFRVNSAKLLLATSIASFSGFAGAQTLNVLNNTVNVTADGVPAFAAAPVIAANGLLPDITGIPTVAGGFNVPSFSYTLEQNGVADGAYTFSAGFVIDDDTSMRRIEILIPGIVMTFTGGVLSGAITAPTVTVLGRSGSGTTQIQGSFTSNSATFSGSTLTFDAKNQLDFIVLEEGILADIITTINTMSSGHYTYAVFLKQTGGPATLQFGTKAGATFTAFPRIQTTCTLNTNSQTTSQFLLNGNALAATFNLAYGLQGQFNFAGASSSVGPNPVAFTENCIPEPEPEPTVEETVEAITDTITDLGTTDLTNPDNIDAALIETVDSLIEDTATLTTDTATDLESGDITTDTALNVVETTVAVLDIAADVTEGGGELNVEQIDNALDGITDIFNAVSNTGDTLTAAEVETIQNQTESTVDIVSALIVDDTSVEDTATLIDSVAELIDAALDTGASLDNELFTSSQSLTQTALESTLADIAKALDDTSNITFVDDATTQDLLSNNPSLLFAVLDTVAIQLSSSIPLDKAATEAKLESSGLSASDASRLADDLAQFVNPTGISQTDSDDNTITAADSISKSFGSGTTLSIDLITGVVTIENDAATSPSFVNVAKVELVPASIPDGLTTLPDGSVLSVSDGIASTLLPAPKDPIAMSSAISTAGFDVSFNSDGEVSVDTGTSSPSFHATLSFDTETTPSSGGNTVTFDTPTGNPADPSFFYKVNYPDGTSQNLLPFIADDNFFSSILSRGFEASTSRNDGVVVISGTSFRPDYFLTPLSSTDTSFLNDNKDATGTAYREVGDRNGDGTTDYEIISAVGKQIIYTLD